MTLIEVITALAILGTILATVVLAKAKHTRQLTLAHRQLEAVAATDQMLCVWWLDPDTIPRSGSGTVPGQSNFSWETHVEETNPIENINASIVRLEVRDKGTKGSAPPLVTLDLVLSEPTDEEKDEE